MHITDEMKMVVRFLFDCRGVDALVACIIPQSQAGKEYSFVFPGAIPMDLLTRKMGNNAKVTHVWRQVAFQMFTRWLSDLLLACVFLAMSYQS